ncbi:MAG TPA: fibronectin type III, partial [Bacteroidetes bacterium]|nr:fibronectin type III [Bacteroidota bacterium]
MLSAIPVFVRSQVLLNADGPGDTYELINSVLAPNNNVVENPECIHPEFGRHIAEVWDIDLNRYVFEFYSHVTPDNDRCINFDRQRVEIKTYDQSPANLKGVSGETIRYK